MGFDDNFIKRSPLIIENLIQAGVDMDNLVFIVTQCLVDSSLCESALDSGLSSIVVGGVLDDVNKVVQVVSSFYDLLINVRGYEDIIMIDVNAGLFKKCLKVIIICRTTPSCVVEAGSENDLLGLDLRLDEILGISE